MPKLNYQQIQSIVKDFVLEFADGQPYLVYTDENGFELHIEGEKPIRIQFMKSDNGSSVLFYISPANIAAQVVNHLIEQGVLS